MPYPRIPIDPAVMVGKTCITGTRITVEPILRWLSAGRSVAELIEAYPHITEDGIRAALGYPADNMCRSKREAAEATWLVGWR